MKKESIPVDISRDSSYISLYEKYANNSKMVLMCNFFQYYSANKSDSPISMELDTLLTDEQKDELFSKLIDVAKIKKDDIIFNSILRNKIKEIREMELSDETLNCDRIKGFIHQNNPPKNGRAQHEIDALFKRIRDAFAHGRTAFNGEFLILEDKSKQLTGRLIITEHVLLEWKKTIEQFYQTLKEEEK